MSPNGKSQDNYLRNLTTAKVLNRPMSQATRIYVLPIKVSINEQKAIKDRVEKLGAKSTPASFANTFLTRTKAPKINASAIRKAIKMDADEGISDKSLTDDDIVSPITVLRLRPQRALTVVTLDWLAQCEKEKITVSCEPYKINFGPDISSRTATSQVFSRSQGGSQPTANDSSSQRDTQVFNLDSSDEEDPTSPLQSSLSRKRSALRTPSASPRSKRAKQRDSSGTPPLPSYNRPKPHRLDFIADGEPFELNSDEHPTLDLTNEPELNEEGEVTILDHSPVPAFDRDPQKHRYACTRPSPLKCINQALVDELNIIHEQRLMTKGLDDKYSVAAYSRAVSVLKAFPDDLSKKENPGRWAKDNLNGIGDKVSKAISQFYKTGRIEEAQTISRDPAFKITKSLMDLYGVGPVKATEYYSRGCRTAEDVVKCGNRLGTNLDPRECLKILPHLKRKICRKEVEMIADEIAVVMRQFMPDCYYVIGGGYRRGKPLSSDIDIIFSKPEEADDFDSGESYELMHKVVTELREKGRMTHYVNVMGADKTYKDGRKYEISSAQFVYLPECHPSSSRAIHRRIDLLVTPRRVFGAVLMGWTGSKQFEKDIRRLATDRGYSFHSTGLAKVKTGSVVSTPTERDIFDLLEVPYMPPHMRNCD